MRLIDADWVLEHVKPYERSDEQWSVTGGTAIRLIHNAIDNTPTVDAIKVTRCKDCKYVNFTEHRDYLRCTKHVAFSFRPNDFCSYGERMEE